MNKANNFLPQFTLDQLADRVAMKLDYFYILFSPDNIWDGIIESCQKVEKEPRSVNSVIVEAEKENNLIRPGTNIKKYHTTLTRIYILLYYRHHDNDIITPYVLRELVKNMGIYAGNNILSKIHKEIDEILSQDEIIKKAMEKKRQESQNPKFSFPNLTQSEWEDLFNEYNDEKLFREFIILYEDEIQPKDIDLECTRLWYVAKDIVHQLWVVDHPESYIERIIKQLNQNKSCENPAEPQYIMICVYAIMRSLDSNHFTMAIQRIENLANPNKEYYYLQDYMNIIKRWINDNNPFDDYDYVDEQSEQKTSTSSDKELTIQPYKTRIEELEKQNKDKDAKIEERDQKIESLTKQLESQKQESKYSNEDFEELKAELEDYRQHKKGLTPRQTAILGYKLAEQLGVLPSNKQDLANPLSQISGWGKRSLEQKICGYFTETEEKEIADIFGDDFPQIAKIIYEKWQSTQVP